MTIIVKRIEGADALSPGVETLIIVLSLAMLILLLLILADVASGFRLSDAIGDRPPLRRRNTVEGQSHRS